MRRIAIVTPGFSADCLETLEEIAQENCEIFQHAGGEQFAAIPCLNDSDAGHGRDPPVGAARTAGVDLGGHGFVIPGRVLGANWMRSHTLRNTGFRER